MSHADKDDVKNIFAGKSFFYLTDMFDLLKFQYVTSYSILVFELHWFKKKMNKTLYHSPIHL